MPVHESYNGVDAPLDSYLETLTGATFGEIALWSDAEQTAGCPLLLLHSINAAGSGFEVRPLFQYYRNLRPVFALEFPGFGHSEKSDRPYTVRLMTDAIHGAVDAIRQKTGAAAIDAMALSLGCEFLARAATERPQAFRTLALISPTGFEKVSPVAIMRRPHPVLHKILSGPPWNAGFFRLLMRRAVIRKFLQKTWGSRHIDEGLLDYDYRLAQQPGAQHAPYYFISGYLFSAEIFDVYRSLALPVWVAHGTRGDFVDYYRLNDIQTSNWRVSVLQTGAFPHFEMLESLVASYETFLQKAKAFLSKRTESRVADI